MNHTNDKKGFLLYFDSFDNLSLLSDEQRGKLLLALYRYAMYVREGEELTPMEALQHITDLDPQAVMAFSFMASDISRDTKEWLRRRNNYQRAARERIAAKQQTEPSPDEGVAKYIRQLAADRERREQERDAAWKNI